MAKKIHVIELKETEIVQVEGTEEFIETVKSRKKHPVFLTNYALKRGYEQGILKSSLISDLLEMNRKIDDEGTENEKASTVLETLAENKMLDVIYLAFVGANPNTDISLDSFLQQYHADYQGKLELYLNIIKSAVAADPNAFAKGLEKSTAAPTKDEKK